MAFNKETEIWAHKQLSRDVDLIIKKSPDLAVDLAVLMWIFDKRDWRGNFKGWAQLPADWFSRRSKMGFKRIIESANRLEGLGVIQKMSDKGRRHSAMRYKYALRDKDYNNWFEEKRNNLPDIESVEGAEEALDKMEEIVIEQTHEPPKTEATKTPKLVLPRKIELPPMLDGKICYRILKWSGATVKFQEVDKDTYAASLTCVLCGNKFDATQTAVKLDESGIHPQELFVKNKEGITGQVCIACGAAYCVEHEKPYFISGTTYSPDFRYKERWLAKEKEITELRDK